MHIHDTIFYQIKPSLMYHILMLNKTNGEIKTHSDDRIKSQTQRYT